MIYDDAALYDLQYANYRDDVAFYRGLAMDQGGSVLELGAGTGRLTEALASVGHRVVAVDASSAMLKRAHSRLTGAGLLENGAVELHQGDMRNVRLGRRFELVIAPFNTLMHAYTLEDQDRTLATAAEHLTGDGLFAFDLYLPKLGPSGVVRREREWAELKRGADLFLVQYHEPNEQLITSDYFLDERLEGGALRRRTARLVQRYYHRFELERALRAAGLGRVRFFGGFDKRRLDETSALMVGVARRG